MSGRRANGEGTVYLRSDGRWVGSPYVPIRSGRRVRRSVYGRTREEAHRKLTVVLRQAQQGIPAAEANWSVERYLNYWLDEVVQHERRPATVATYRKIVERFILPSLARKRLDRLTPQDVRLLINACREQRRTDGEPMSTWTVQMVHAVLRNAVQHAVAEEIVPRNVVKLVRVPAPSYEVGTGLSADQARAILQRFETDRLLALYVLALTLGLRKGELLGLRWVDVDFEAGEVHVRQAAQRVGGVLRFDPPKTRRSRRTLPLPGTCLDALREHKARQARERLAAGPSWAASGLVFTTRHGTPIEPRNLNRHWHATREAIGLSTVRFHDLRHTCVTLLLDLDAPPHIVQAIAGHSAIDVTMTIYAHASREEQRRALQRLADRLA